MVEVINALAADIRSMSWAELLALLITLLTTLIGLCAAMERLVNAISHAIRALIEFVCLVLHREDKASEQ